MVESVACDSIPSKVWTSVALGQSRPGSVSVQENYRYILISLKLTYMYLGGGRRKKRSKVSPLSRVEPVTNSKDYATTRGFEKPEGV